MIERWYKAPVDCLFDVRVARLSAGLFRAWHQMMALASLNGGVLPGVEQIAYSVRSSAATVVKRLVALAERGLAVLREGVWRLVDQLARETDDAEAEGPRSGAQRTRDWRARKGGDMCSDTTTHDTPAGESHVTAVTTCDAPREEKKREDQTPIASDARACEDFFSRFWAAYPSRTGANPIEPARSAFHKALELGADPARIIDAARAYAGAMADTDPRYVASAARWLDESRWQDTPVGSARKPVEPQAAPGVWIAQDTPEWEPWAALWLAERGRSPPTDNRGGWRFPSLVPPAAPSQAMAA
jgi:hypothetical protein